MELDDNSKINAMRRQRPGNIAIERTEKKVICNSRALKKCALILISHKAARVHFNWKQKKKKKNEMKNNFFVLNGMVFSYFCAVVKWLTLYLLMFFCWFEILEPFRAEPQESTEIISNLRMFDNTKAVTWEPQ